MKIKTIKKLIVLCSSFLLIACSRPNCHKDDVTESIKKLYAYNAHPQIRDKTQQMYHLFGTHSAELETQLQDISTIQLNDIDELSYSELKEYLKLSDSNLNRNEKYKDANYICVGTINEKISEQSINYAKSHRTYNLESVIQQQQISVPIIYTITYNETNDEDHIGYTMVIDTKNLADFDLVRILLRQSDPKYKNAQIENSPDTF